jgi:hypothetical protein
MAHMKDAGDVRGRHWDEIWSPGARWFEVVILFPTGIDQSFVIRMIEKL